jgi:zinc transport system substrate-binding protein
MFKKIIAASLCLLAIAAFSACSKQANAAADGKVKVSVTFDALREFVLAVGGDKVYITTIIPDGTEPHDFEPKGKDLASLSNADIFVYSGLGMEAWAAKAMQAAINKNLITVEASKGADPITNTDQVAVSGHGSYDPHLWLSLKGAEIETQNIKDALVKADPSNKDFYEKNCNDFISQLESLYNEYNAKFQTVKNKSFVTGHAAFAYLCRDFDLKQNSVEDVFAEGEPSAQKLKELIDYCKQNNVKTIFVEDMVSPAVSQTLADEVGAKVQKVYTIESVENGKDYIERMKDNLSEIYGSLSK